MIIMSDRFDNELTSEKGVGKVFDKVNLEYNLTSICRIRERSVIFFKFLFFNSNWQHISFVN